MQLSSQSTVCSRQSLVPSGRRNYRIALLTGLVMSLVACGGGGGGGTDSPAAPAPSAQSYSSVYFTNANSTVAFVNSAPDGSGIVGYRNAAGEVARVDFLTKDKTVYRFGIANGRVETMLLCGGLLDYTRESNK